MTARLSAQRSFQRLRAEGIRTGRGPLRLVSRHDPSQPPRFAFAIPRSVGNSVVRNRIKRRIRAVLEQIDATEPTGLSGGDHLVRVTAPLDHWSYDTLLSTMTELLSSGLASTEAHR